MKIPEAYLTIIDPLIAKARWFLEAGEQLSPIAFVGNLSTGQMLPVVIDTSEEASKDKSMEAVKSVATDIAADFVFMVSEAWSLRKDKIGKYEEILRKYGSVAESPYREEVASFSLETTHGLWVGIAPIRFKYPSKKRRTFGSFEFQFADGVEGRFTGLLTTRENSPGLLH